MRYILVPDPIDVVNPVTKEEGKNVPFTSFIEELLCDQRFGVNIKTIDIAYEIQAALDRLKAAPTKYLALESAHYDLLRAVVEAPTGGYRPGLGVQMRPFIKAVSGALESEPKEEVEAKAQ